MYEFLRKNWVTILLVAGLVFAVTSTGILKLQSNATRGYLNEARARVVELTGIIDNADNRIRELEKGLGLLGKDYKQLDENNKLLKKQYLALRGHYLQLEAGNHSLTQSNDRSIRLVREGIDIIQEIRKNN